MVRTQRNQELTVCRSQTTEQGNTHGAAGEASHTPRWEKRSTKRSDDLYCGYSVNQPQTCRILTASSWIHCPSSNYIGFGYARLVSIHALCQDPAPAGDGSTPPTLCARARVKTKPRPSGKVRTVPPPLRCPFLLPVLLCPPLPTIASHHLCARPYPLHIPPAYR